MKRSIMMVTALTAIFGAVQMAAAADGEAIYNKSCKSCHNTGFKSAPKLGDKEKWAALVKGGQAALDESVMKGKGAMKPKGGNDALTADDIKAANAYLISKSQ